MIGYWILSNAFSTYWDDHIAFILHSVDVTYDVYYLENVKLLLHMNMMYYLYMEDWIWIVSILLKFCIYIHQWCMSVSFHDVPHLVLVSKWCWPHKKRLAQFHAVKYFEIDWKVFQFYFKCFIGFSSKVTRQWNALWWKAFNYCFNLTAYYSCVSIFCMLLI